MKFCTTLLAIAKKNRDLTKNKPFNTMLDMTNIENNDQWRQIGYRDDLSTSLEDYLEAIYAIILDQSAVRVKDIARRLEVKNSSVTSALKALTAKKLINHEPYGIITLTQEGNKVARRIYEKHKIVEGFLIKVLGVNPEEAGVWACRIEACDFAGYFETSFDLDKVYL